MKNTTLWMLIPVFALALGANAEAKKVNALTITCEEFAAQTPEAQKRIVAFADGYSKKGVAEEAVGEVDVKRVLDVAVIGCVETPKATWWDKLKAKLPGGSKKVKPVKMTCEEFLALDKDVQPEVAYFLDGYNRKDKTDVAVAGEVDLERDTAVFVEICKPAPKESLWAKIKSKL
jgi:HdeA/HdeB family